MIPESAIYIPKQNDEYPRPLDIWFFSSTGQTGASRETSQLAYIAALFVRVAPLECHFYDLHMWCVLE